MQSLAAKQKDKAEPLGLSSNPMASSDPLNTSSLQIVSVTQKDLKKNKVIFEVTKTSLQTTQQHGSGLHKELTTLEGIVH